MSWLLDASDVAHSDKKWLHYYYFYHYHYCYQQQQQQQQNSARITIIQFLYITWYNMYSIHKNKLFYGHSPLLFIHNAQILVLR